MEISLFDTTNGIYQFQLEQLTTEEHLHPAWEVIYAKDGSFSLICEEKTYSDITFALLPAGIKHRLEMAKKGTIEIDMYEHNGAYLMQNLSLPISSLGNVFTLAGEDNLAQKTRTKLHERAVKIAFDSTYSTPVQQCLNALNDMDMAYPDLMERITATTRLSASRISHIFKAEVRVSLKRYFTWSRLKFVMQGFLAGTGNLYQLGLQFGFYDQAHFSKTFKRNMGIAPSTEYNSSILQAPPKQKL